MSSPAEMAERHGRMLAELAELGLGLARDLHGQALAAESPQEKAQLADAFHRLSRSVRQSLALEAKLQRDTRREAREDREEQARATEVRKAARKAELKKRVRQLIWDEVETPEIAGAMVDDAPEFIEREAETETFLDEPIEAQIARIREALGVDEAWDVEDEEPEEPGAEAPDGGDADGASDEGGRPADPPPAPPKPPWPSPYDDWPNSA